MHYNFISMNDIREDIPPRSQMDVITCGGKVSPMFLFDEYTFISEELKDGFTRYCIDRGYIPFIDYDTDYGSWIFHSITYKDLIWKKPVSEKFESHESKEGNEAALEKKFVAHLKQLGVASNTQVICKAGIADIVTQEKIYEAKDVLTGSSLFRAIGQVLLYRQCINPSAGAAIICNRSLVEHLHPVALLIGVEIIVWSTA